MKKNDICLLLTVLLLGACISFLSSREIGKGEITNVIVKLDGQVIHSYSLDEGRHDITTEYGYNIIEISDGKVYVSESDCDGRDCVNMGQISRVGERIVCIPHHMEIYIEGDTEVDTVAY